MQVEHRIKIAAAPQSIFRIYQDVRHWHTWDPDTRWATLEGPFAVGSRGRLMPTQGRAVPMVLTQVVRDSSFTVESKIPLFCMRFEHELRPSAGMTEAIHRVTLSGPLTLLLGRMLTRRLNTGLPVTLSRLKTLAESLGAASSQADAGLRTRAV
jgi:Polyketide cyclase / dehydrase and lipid transport